MSKKKKLIILEDDPLAAGSIQTLPETELGDKTVTISIAYDDAVCSDETADDALMAAVDVLI